jgi:hypothetical protein
MTLRADGTMVLRLNCNSATGTWSAEASVDSASGRFSFGPLAATMAICPPPSMDEQVGRDTAYIRSYLLRDGRLFLSLMADAGIYAWEPDDAVPYRAQPDPALEAAILQASPAYVREVIGGVGQARYVYSRIDLNGDGHDEVLAFLMGSFFCGTGGCSLQLFTPGVDGYRLVNDFPISRAPVIVSAQKSNGWNDLWRLESGGGAPASYVRHSFDGQTYVLRERVTADQAPAGRRCLAGEPSFAQGAVLEPLR